MFFLKNRVDINLIFYLEDVIIEDIMYHLNWLKEFSNYKKLMKKKNQDPFISLSQNINM